MAVTKIPSFDELSDNDFAGYHFKDEGSYLAVKFEKATGKPAGNGLYEFGSLVTVTLDRIVIAALNRTSDPLYALKHYFQLAFDKELVKK